MKGVAGNQWGRVANNRGRKRKRGLGLRSRLEKFNTPTTSKKFGPEPEGEDAELLQYVSAFMEDLSRIPSIESFNLFTPESAREALVMLESNHGLLQDYLRRAQTLKELLEERRGFKEH